ncbi:hypothetical protein DFQ26_008259 [Actinomortierella ambigua]|nr:hypothetical protein DFQ26_008259 [Actinomortierella ambigua]
MNRAVDPLRRLVVQLNSRLFAQTRPPPVGTQVLPHTTHHTHHYHHHAVAHVHPHQPVPTATIVPSKASIFGQFERKVPSLAHKDGPALMKHLAQTHKLLVPEPVRVAAVNYACRSAGRPKMASLLSQHANRQRFHQPLVWGSTNGVVPHAFAKNVGLSSSRGYCSTTLAMNGPVKALAQMYAKPLGSLPTHAQKHQLSEKDLKQQSPRTARKVHHRPSSDDTKPRRRRGARRQAPAHSVSFETVQAFIARATQMEQQREMAMLCDDVVMAPITEAVAISLAKVTGRTEEELEELPKLVCSDDCPTSVDMCFLLDSSPLWHLDTMVSALHTDSLRAPRVLNRDFIDDLLEISNCQYQHYMEVSTILQRLVRCPEAREISLIGYELRVHFEGTSLFEMHKFLKALGIDPLSPNFELEELYADDSMQDRYFPDTATMHYYNRLSMMTGEDTWDDCSSIASGLGSSVMMTPSEYSSSQVSLVYMSSAPAEQTAWETVASLMEFEKEQLEQDDDEQEGYNNQESTPAPSVETKVELVEVEDEDENEEYEGHGYDSDETSSFLFDAPAVEDEMIAWAEEEVDDMDVRAEGRQAPISQMPSPSSSQQLQEQQMPILAMSSQILNSTPVGQEYFENIRMFLDSLEAMNNNPFA